MKHKTRTMAKRWLALVLCLCMTCSSALTFVSAAEKQTYTGGLCEHHKSHTAECGYVEAVAGHPCAHVHDENCGYCEPAEEIPCTHTHDASCGYQEAKAEIPCDKGCIDVDGDGNIDHQEGCSYQPAVEEQPCTHTHDGSCGYQAATEGSPCTHVHDDSCGYVEAIEEQPCTFVCTECAGKVLRSAGNTGETLDGDYAYIDALDFSSGAGYQNKAIMTGTAPWDADDENGNDTTDSNGTVRSFDVVTYTVEMQNKVRQDNEFSHYKEGVFYYELILPASPGEARFETDSMGWLTSKPNAQHDEVFTTTYKGQDVQVLRGHFTWAPTGDNPTAIGESMQTLNVAIRVLAMRQGEKVQPLFTFWMDHNAVPQEGLVTGSDYKCPTHNEVEYKTVTSPEITVTTAPRYNVALKSGWNTNYLGTFDFSTGNDSAQNKTAGVRNGRIQAFGVTLQVEGKPGQGLRGCEIPDGSPITFDLKLSSTYTKTEGERIDAATVSNDGFSPLLWSAEGNKDSGTQEDGRSIAQGDKYAFLAAPFNTEAGSPYKEYACKDGGTWSVTQNNDTVSVSVSDYDVDLNRIPNTVAKNDPNDTTYYDPAVFESGYWNVQTACFSAGEFWVVQPFNSQGGEMAANKYGSGQFNLTISDVNLQATGISGNGLPQVADNSNQATQTDDRESVNMALEQPGEIEQYINYSGTDITNACHDNGKDWSLTGADINITEQLAHLGAEGQNTAVAYDDLLKFDDAFFDIKSVSVGDKNGVDKMKLTLLYGAKPDKSGWDHGGKHPGDDGYDEEMINATADNLIFFTSLEELEDQGYTCVAVLLEARGVASSQITEIYFTATGKLQDTATDGNVYMVTHSAKAWSKANVQAAAADALGKEAGSLTDEDYISYAQGNFPSRTGQATALKYENYPTSFWTNDVANREGLKNYKKSQYDENGYKDGTTNRNYGDSCLVVNYATQIGKRVMQQSTSTGAEKLVYDLDSAQNVADYALDLTAIRTAGEFTSGETKQTTVYVEDVLPANLTYIPYSANLGGEYTQTGEGKQGQVTGGMQVEPNVIQNDNGTTTLRWTLPDQMITADAITDIGTIYYACDISNNAQNNDELPNTATIWSADEQKKDFNEANGNKVQRSIRISKNSAVSLSKTADQTRVETGETMGFTMNIGNNAANPLPIIAVDSLPYSGEDSASEMHGDCVVTEFAITALANEFNDNFKLYYTENKDLQGKGSADFQGVDFANSSDWKAMTVNSDTGAVTLPGDDFKPVAIAAVGTLSGNQTLKMHITVELPDGEPGDRVVNRLTLGNMNSSGRSYLFGRTLEGVVWLDSNENGLRDDGEKVQDGVSVTLLKLKEGGNVQNFADYEVYQVNGKNAAVNTGQKMDLLTGQIVSGETGTYKFTNLPEGTFAVRFADGTTFTLDEYAPTAANVGNDDTIDSDAEGVNDGNGKLEYAYISGIEMPSENQIPGNVYEVKYQDLGLVEAEEETIDIPVTKIWNDNDNQDGKRPNNVTVTLYANNEKTDKTLTLSDANNWTGSFDNLPESEDGKKISYEVKETSVNEYTTEITGSAADGYTITNSHTPETVDISGAKTWNDAENQDGKRPESITIRLYANGTELEDKAQTVTEDDGWEWSFTNLPKYENGVQINYTIFEDTVQDYTTTVNGYDVTNSYTPGKTSVGVTKSWQDNNDQDGIRPESITVKLLANGKDTGKTLTLSEGNRWTGSFTDLDVYADGKEITYTIEEVKVSDYDTTITGDAATGYVITNSHTPETVDISGAKTWNDAENQDGKRPESITIRLYANGTELEDKAQTVTEDDGWEWSFTNLPKYENGVQINYTIFEDTVQDYTTTVNGYDVTNSYTPGKTSVGVTKSWQDNNDQDGIRPESITVKLLANGKDTGKTLTLSEGNKWTDSFTELDAYADGKEITYTIEEVKVSDYDTTITGDAVTGYVITNSHTPETVDISGTKTWDDAENQDGKRPESITIRLYANGTELEDKAQTVTGDDGWAWSFTNLPKYENGVQINYTISEDTVQDYTTTVNGYDVTNSYTPGKTSVGVTKSWQDNNDQDGIRPESITVKLLANGKDTGKTLTLSEGNKWTDSFTELDAYADGKEITYTIEEVKVSDYDTTITGDAVTGYVITNSHTPETVDISGTKTWDDAENQDGKRPESITIRLYANGTELEDKAQTVTGDDGWAWSFTNLPKYENGVQINYTISEDTVQDYTTTVNGYDVTNSYTPGKTSVGVTKSWQDNNDQDGIRPESITVKLLANGKDTGKTLTLSEGNRWTGSFTDLDVYADGKEITYTIEEVKVSDYDTTITGDAATGYVITNSHTPETVDISGAKTWDDAENQDGKRPESITIRLYANGTEVNSKEVTAEESWAWSFTNLPKYENGVQINYTISEDTVQDYTTTVNGYDVTNSYTPGKTSVGVTKSWQDNNDQDGIRPESITVKLLANGKDTGKTLTLSEGNKWTDSFTELDAYADGKEITYTIEEVKVSDYDTTITGDAVTGYVITNSHTPETVDISGTKTWDDAENQDGKRPESITIRLYANGTELEDKAQTVTGDDGWAWSFTNLPKYENGVQINYTISEDTVQDYTTTVNGYDVTNSYTPGKTSVGVTKSWQDNNDQDGIRPESITVKLLANGKDTGKTLTLSEGNKWTDSFTDLDEYADGEKIVYTIEEVTVTGYDTVITGDAAKGYVITNSHTPETVDISGTKTWDDAENQDGKRPESITIRLYANGEQAEVVTVTAEDGWVWKFENLPKCANGSEINYSITEDAVSGYQSEIDGMDVTNRYTPGKVNIHVTKNWQDKNNADGIRPESITVKLYADGEDTGKELVLNQKNNWTGSFDDLDEYADGTKILYTIVETKVDGYDTVISGSVETGFVITNSHTPDIPEGFDKPNQPKDNTLRTGDTTNLALWISLLAISGIGVTAILVLGKKKRYHEKHMK
mgnify:CR=1 FL=1